MPQPLLKHGLDALWIRFALAALHDLTDEEGHELRLAVPEAGYLARVCSDHFVDPPGLCSAIAHLYQTQPLGNVTRVPVT